MKKLALVILGVTLTAMATIGFMLIGLALQRNSVQPVDTPRTEKASFNYTVSDVRLLTDLNVVVMDNSKVPLCGGTLINHKNKVSVLTALHCVADDNDDIIPYGFIKFGPEIYKVKVVKFTRAQDLALLSVVDQTEPLPVAGIGKQIALGEEVWIIGFGAGQEDILSHGTVAMPDSTSQWTGTHVSVIDGSAFYGNSGGGIFNASNELIGVLIQIGPSGSPGLWMYAVHLSEIIRFLG